MNPDLAKFLEHARSRGMDHGTIRMLLLSAGWKEKDIARALAAHALDLPVPAPTDSGGARDAFLHLVTFAALYAAAIACVTLLFQYVSLWLPDPAFRATGQAQVWMLRGIRWGLAVLLVSFPAYLVMSRTVLREMRAQPEKAWSAIRRWLTYLTLFVAALALATDFVTLVFFFLEGELSARFLTKVALVALVAGLPFVYYLSTVRMPAASLATSRMHRSFAAVAGGLVVVTLVCGFAIVGSPLAERLRKLDERRVEDLRAVEAAIDRICLGDPASRPREQAPEMQRPLPGSLDEVVKEAPDQRPSVLDPATGASYEYAVSGATSFELCAVFDQVRDVDYDARWNHPAGRHCFAFDLMRPE